MMWPSSGSESESDGFLAEGSDGDDDSSQGSTSPVKDPNSNVYAFQQILKRWEEGHTSQGSSYDPTTVLSEMCELLEKECDNYLATDPDPFEDRHPSRVNPDCQFGQILKSFFKKENLVHELFNNYLRDNYWTRNGLTKSSFDLNVAACRVLLDIVPGLEASVLMETDGLVKRLYVWAEKAEQPLQSYATGLLGVAMELSDVATDSDNREKNNHIVPIMLDRLKNLRKTNEDLFKRPFKIAAGSKRSSAEFEDESFKDHNNHKSLKSPEHTLKPGWPVSSNTSSGSLSLSLDHEWSNSSWVEMESQVIGHFPIYPLDTTAQQIFILRYLTPLGEYQEFITYIFDYKILELLMGFINLRETNNARLAFEALKFTAALFCHKKFVLDFVTSPLRCLPILLEIPRPSIAATAVSQCLYYIGGDDDAMEKICNMQQPLLIKMIRFVLWAIECSHDSGRQFAIMFFGQCCSYRILLEILDEQDCIRKVYNSINTLSILGMEDASILTDDQEYAQRQQVRQVMVAFKRYCEAHLAIKAETYKKITRTSYAEVPITRANRFSSVQVSENVEFLLEWMPFRSRWIQIENFVDLGCMNKCLQIIAMAYDWTFPGRSEMVKSALDVLTVCAIIPKAQLQMCELVDLPEDNKPVGINILLSAAEGEIVQDSADVQRSALNVIINLVSAPVVRQGGANLSQRFQGSATKKKFVGRTSEEHINKMWDCVRSNNGIMVLLQLLHVKTPITDADSIRALACKALVGLARSPAAKQIMSKLPIFNNGQLQQLVREPVLQDKRTEHVKFQHHAHDLMELVSGPGGPRRFTGENDFSLEMLHRASIVAQTRISFSREQLLQLIHEYLSAQGLSETSASLQKEANLMLRLPPAKPSASFTLGNRGYVRMSGISQRAHSYLMTPTNHQPTSPPSSLSANQPIRINRARRLNNDTPVTNHLSITNASISVNTTPNTPMIAKPLQKAFESVPEENNRITLESIMCDYLSNQHSLCKNPMVTCPEFDLFQPHKCPDPRPRKLASLNVSTRISQRSCQFPPHGGMEGHKLDRKLIYSRFRPLRVFRDTAETDGPDNQFSSCTFTPSEEFILCGTYLGDVKMFNVQTGSLESTYSCHESQVTHLEMNREGTLLLTSSAWRTPYSCLWTFGEFFDNQLTFKDEDYVEFSKSIQDKVIATKNETAIIYDIATGDKIRELKPHISNNYMRNRATFDPSDELVLNDGVLFDLRMGKEIRKLDKLNPNLNGVFHPNGLEIISNSEVWDIRTFHLLKTVPGLDQCQVKFSNSGDIIYAVGLEKETDDDGEQYDSSFKTFDASDYSSIATIETKRAVLDVASSKYDLMLAVVENSSSQQVSEESVVRLYDVGRFRDEDEDVDDADNEEDEEDEPTGLGDEDDEDDDDGDEEDDVIFVSSGSSDSDSSSSEESVNGEDENVASSPPTSPQPQNGVHPVPVPQQNPEPQSLETANSPSQANEDDEWEDMEEEEEIGGE